MDLSQLDPGIVLSALKRGDLTVEEALERFRGRLRKIFRYDEHLLKDHVIYGERVLMGVAHASLVLDAARPMQRGRGVSLRRVLLQRAMVVPMNGVLEVDVEIVTGDNGATFSTFGHLAGAEERHKAATGEIVWEALPAPRSIDLEAAWRSASAATRSCRIYQPGQGEFAYGPSLLSVREIRVGSAETWGTIELTDQARAEDDGYWLPPAVLDAAHVLSTIAAGSEAPHWPPLLIKALSVHVPASEEIPRALYCCARVTKQTTELREAHLELYDRAGRLVVSIDGFAMKRVPSREALLGTTSDGHPNSDAPVPARPQEPPQTEATSASSDADLQSRIGEYIVAKLVPLVGASQSIAVDRNFMDLGVDSASIITLVQRIESELRIELYPTLFFEYQNVRDLTRHFFEEHRSAFERLFGVPHRPAGEPVVAANPVEVGSTVKPDSSPSRTPVLRLPRPEVADSKSIAVIGMAGRLPQSETLDQFWTHLAAGSDLVSEVTPDRWKVDEWFSENRKAANKTYSKWGGFLPNVDRFDAELFGIPAVQAEWYDPQARLLLEVSHELFEDAGYGERIRGTRTGVYVGVCFQEFWDEIVRARVPLTGYEHSSSAMSAVSGLLSFHFDLQGPSVPLDNACASSLTALHLACRALRSGECDLAVAAGVNLLLSPLHYVYFSRMQALSPTGRCHSFDRAADGYVPGEGVVALLLKPLTAAERDGDQIHAVIKGSAVNHVGRSNSLTAPRPELQIRVMQAAWKDAELGPESLSYIEAHGTGTELGDPIEINALKRAFGAAVASDRRCAIGSAKAHMGHLEGAAGIASIIKVILSLKHRQIPAMPNFRELNPFISLEGSPFYINRTLEEWPSSEGTPRRAGVSSFGMTGNNAHVVLEEYDRATDTVDGVGDRQPQPILLSARTEEQLRIYAARMARFLVTEGGSAPTLSDIAYTLQTARPTLSYRVAVVASNNEDLAAHLTAFAAGEPAPGVIMASAPDPSRPNLDFEDDADERELIALWMRKGRLAAVARLWTQGIPIPWGELYVGQKRRLVSLPASPLNGQHFQATPFASVPRGEHLQPPLEWALEVNESTLDEVIFARTFRRDEPLVKGNASRELAHIPEAVLLAMVVAAGERSRGGEGIALRDVVMGQPVVLGGAPSTRVHVSLTKVDGELGFDVFTLGPDGSRIVHSQGGVAVTNKSAAPDDVLDIEAITSRCGNFRDGAAQYEMLSRHGLEVGPELKVIDGMSSCDREALATFRATVVEWGGSAEPRLQPQILAGALQAAAGFISGSDADMGRIVFPAAIGEVTWRQALPAKGFFYVRPTATPAADALARLQANPSVAAAAARDEIRTGQALSALRVREVDVDVVDEGGRRSLTLRQLVMAAVHLPAERSPDSTPVLSLHEPLWVPTTEPRPIDRKLGGILLCDDQAALDPAWQRTFGVVTHVRLKDSLDPSAANAQVRAIDPRRREECLALVDELSGRGGIPPVLVLRLRNRERNDSIEMWAERHVLFALHLIQALSERRTVDPLRILWVADGLDGGRPEHSAFASFARALRRENQTIRASLLQIVPNGTRVEESRENDVVAAVAREASDSCGEDVEVQVDAEGRRRVRQWRELTARSGEAAAQARHGGVYVITGGAGRLGRLCAADLARVPGTRIALIGRTAPAANILKQLAAGRNGAVAFFSADVADRSALARVVEQVSGDWGPIKGVMHAAGVVRDAFALRKSDEDVRAVLRPKIAGTVCLDEVTAEQPLDFFLLFSSLVSLVGNVGQTDYAYANGFLDAFAREREALRAEGRRRGRTLVINWPLWKEGGMQAGESTRAAMHRLGLRELPTDEGLKVLKRPVPVGVTQIAALYGERGRAQLAAADADGVRV